MRQRRISHSAAKRLVLFIVGVAVFYGSYYLGSRHAPMVPRFLNFRALEKPQALANLSLRDHYGNPFDAQRLTGHWNLVIFGYTGAVNSVRDRLILITHVKNRLAALPHLQQITRGLLVTVAPDTDKPAVLNSLMSRFSPDFLALTGSPEEIRSLARSLGIIIRHSATADSKDFRIEHSSSIALIDPDANLIGLFTGVVDAASIAADIKQLAFGEAE
ncbi:MAG: SCO family protein [Gammaproteobacteria bacterium]|nr:SCO family protein [Gammaproteobacteria bacterium]